MIRVMHSKHTTVQLPKDGQPDAGLTKDYGNSGLHRFKKPGSKNYQNIYPPSATLHLSNIPSSIEEDDLKKAFDAINLTVQVGVNCGKFSSPNYLSFRRLSFSPKTERWLWFSYLQWRSPSQPWSNSTTFSCLKPVISGTFLLQNGLSWLTTSPFRVSFSKSTI